MIDEILCNSSSINYLFNNNMIIISEREMQFPQGMIYCIYRSCYKPQKSN